LYLGTFIPSLIPDQYDFSSTELTPAESEPCHCCSCFIRKKKERKKFTVRRMPGKIAHLVPMQRFDPTMMKRTLSIGKPSNTNYHQHSPTKLPPNTTITTSPLGAKTSLDNPSIIGWSPLPPPPFSSNSSSHLPIHPSTSIHSLKPSYEQATNVKNPDNAISQARLQIALSRFRQDAELIPVRFDTSVKRSSV
jgi:hypothetical protein